MSDTGTGKPSIGDEIPYRRDRLDKKTGSLVFDQHLGEAVGDAPGQSGDGLDDVPEQSVDEDMPQDDNPLKRGQVT
jgi:hypothetical protein